MDEGSIATLKQFHQHVAHLMRIFHLNYSVESVYHWVPRDNNIGENEPIKNEKVDEFQRIFMQPHIVTFKNISFYKVNAITNTFKIIELIMIIKLLSPIILLPIDVPTIAHQVNNEIHPNIYFCAHTHDAKYVRQTKDLSERKTERMTTWKGILSVMANDKSLYEIYVPTCLYRMDTNKIGYGAAVLENNNMRYAVFWSPQRFIFLFVYLAFLFVFVWFWLVLCCGRLIRTCRRWVPRLHRQLKIQFHL